MFKRTELLIGKNNLNKLKNTNILVVGCGGVGGYICEFLVRTGIENLTIIDFDKVELSNKNRQIIALNSTMGKQKVDVLKDRLLDINENAKVIAINERFNEELLNKLDLTKFDYVIDAIDDVRNKVLLIKECFNKNIFCISAMGAGNRYDIPNFKVSDIFKTYNDGLAKVLRKKLKDEGVTKHKVVFSESKPAKIDRAVGSVAYYPPASASVLVGYIINDIISK